MDSSYYTNPLVFITQTIIGLYILVVMLRFLLQWAKADFYNPMSQFIVKITTPALRPLRRIIPGLAGLDMAALVLMWLLKTIELSLVIFLKGSELIILGPLLWAIPELLNLAINVFLFAIFIQVIISWISPGTYNPVTTVLYSLTEPILRPARRMIPPISGLDLSPMAAIMGLYLLKMLLLPPLHMLTGNPFQ
ncbi:Cell division integral membrane protein, YggT and half-length relatives [hydrothermal vent metagenome]|uniref:Cell division integral membrane protein, YggT and half-length relatives n=1 Tax=hydrothermal vent metagenome TaxID=652676 RepID=A0A3B1AKM4_9ZZZZ